MFNLDPELFARESKRVIDAARATMDDHQAWSVPPEKPGDNVFSKVVGMPVFFASHDNAHAKIIPHKCTSGQIAASGASASPRGSEEGKSCEWISEYAYAHLPPCVRLAFLW